MQLVIAPDSEKNMPSAIRGYGRRSWFSASVRMPDDLRGRRPGRDVRLPVHDVRCDDEVVVAPIDNAAVVSQADRLPPVVDAREDVDRAALPDVRQSRHGSGIGARDKKAPRLR